MYCHKRSDCDELAAMLDAEATPTVPYHSGLKDEQRYLSLLRQKRSAIDE